MKTKRKEKEETKRSEDKKVKSGIEPLTFDAPGQSFTTRPHGTLKEHC